LGATRLSGFDLDLHWRIPVADLGQFTFSFNGTYFANYDTQNPDGTFSPQVGNLNNATTGGVIPRVKTYQSVNWAYGTWDATLALNWQSSYLDVPGNGKDTTDPAFRYRRVGAYETVDAQVSYSGIKGLRLTLGAKNLLDRDPPYTNQGFSFQSGYDPQYADPRGRFVYLRGTYAF
jgi:iron complex outermembrane receptor protein